MEQLNISGAEPAQSPLQPEVGSGLRISPRLRWGAEGFLLLLLVGAAGWHRCSSMGLQYISDDDVRMLVPALDVLAGKSFPLWGHAVGPIHYGALNIYLYALLLLLSWRPGTVLVLGAAVHIIGVLAVYGAARQRLGFIAACLAAGGLAAHPWAIAAARNLGTTYFALPFAAVSLCGLCFSAVARLRVARLGPYLGLTGASLAALSHPTGMAAVSIA